MAAVKTHLTYYADSRSAPQASDILCDADGQWFVSYLDCVLTAVDDAGPAYSEFLEHKKAVEAQLAKFKNNRLSFQSTLGGQLSQLLLRNPFRVLFRGALRSILNCLEQDRNQSHRTKRNLTDSDMSTLEIDVGDLARPVRSNSPATELVVTLADGRRLRRRSIGIRGSSAPLRSNARTTRLCRWAFIGPISTKTWASWAC